MGRTVGKLKKMFQNRVQTTNEKGSEDDQSVVSRKRKRENTEDDVDGDAFSKDDDRAKRRRVRDLISNAYAFAERYNTSFALVIQVEGSSEIKVAGIGFTLGMLRKRNQIRCVKFLPPSTERRYIPSLEVCKNVKMNESLKPQETEAKKKSAQQNKTKTNAAQNKKQDRTKAKKKMSKENKPTDVSAVEKTKQHKKTNIDLLDKSGDKKKKQDMSDGKKKSQVENMSSKVIAESQKESSNKPTWDASSETVGLEVKKNKLSRKKADLDLKMPKPGTINRKKFDPPTVKSKFAI